MPGGNIRFTFGPPSHADGERGVPEDPALAAAFAPAQGEAMPAEAVPLRGLGELDDTGAFTPEGPGEPDQAMPRRPGGWLAPAGMVLATLAWTAWFGVTHYAGFATLDPNLVSGLVGLWSCPVMLIAVAWLIVQRSSRREAWRFADAAKALSGESEPEVAEEHGGADCVPISPSANGYRLKTDSSFTERA